MQFKAGYFLNSIFDLYTNHSVKEKVERIVLQLSHFELETSDDLTHRPVNYSPEVKIINNLITRGVPTIPGLIVEEILSETLKNTKKSISPTGEISFPFSDDALTDSIYRAIHIIDSRIDKSLQQTNQVEKKEYKEANHKKLLDTIFSEYLSEAYIQLIEENRDYESIAKSGNYVLDPDQISKYQAILSKKNDFVLEMPYVFNRSRGICFEFSELAPETRYRYETEQLKKSLGEAVEWSDPLTLDIQKFSESNTVLRPLLNFTYN